MKSVTRLVVYLFMFFFLQVEAPSILNEAASGSVTDSLGTIIIAFISYLVCALIQYFLSLLLKKRDVRNDRQMKITDMTLEKEMELFNKLDHLRTFQKGENHQILDEIVVIKVLLYCNTSVSKLTS